MPDTNPTPVDAAIDVLAAAESHARLAPGRYVGVALTREQLAAVIAELRSARAVIPGPDSERALQNVEAAIRARAEQARSVDRRSQSAIGMLAAAEMIKTSARIIQPPKETAMEQVTITLTDGQAARLDHLRIVTTDTNAEPLSREDYLRQLVVEVITPQEAGDGTSGY